MSSSGRSPQIACLHLRGQTCLSSLYLSRAVHTATIQCQNVGTTVLTGELALTSLTLGTMGTLNGTESD